MAVRRAKPDHYVEQIVEILSSNHLPNHPQARIDAYYDDERGIRVRILDPDYAGMKMEQRWQPFFELIASQLPEAQSEIGMLFFMTPTEAANRYAHMNGEFEDHLPMPSRLRRNSAANSKRSGQPGRRKRTASRTAGDSASS